MLTVKVAPFVDTNVRRRGLEYFAQRRVNNLEVGVDRISASVKGSEDYGVGIAIDRSGPGRWTLRASCTCPYSDDRGGCCKHVWATLLAAEMQVGRVLGSLPLTVRLLEADQDEFDDDTGPRVTVRPLNAVRTDRPLVMAASATHRPGAIRSGADAPKPKKPKRPDWMRLLEQTPRTYAPARRSRSGPIEHVRYILDAERSRQRGAVTISLGQAQAEPLVPGSLGKSKRLVINAADIPRLATPADRVICGMLVGAGKPGRDWSYSYSYGEYGQSDQGSALWQVNQRMLPVLLPMLFETNRFLWQATEQDPPRPLAWDDRPWEVVLSITEGAASEAVISPVFRRMVRDESGESETGRVREPVLALEGEPGVLLDDGVLAPLDGHGCLLWATTLRSARPARVRPEELAGLLGELGKKGLSVPVVWPDSWGVRRIDGMTPRGRLTVAPLPAGGGKNQRIEATASFEYEDAVVTEGDPGLYVHSAPALDNEATADGVRPGAVIRRHIEAESRLLSRLEEHGVRSIPYRSGRETTARRLPALVSALLAEGWAVLGEKGAYKRPSGVPPKIVVSSGIDWFEVRGEVDFDGASASLPDVLAAILRGEQFVPLGDGSLGMLPEDWLDRHARWLRLGASGDGAVRFARTQIGLIDALMAEMPEATCDKQVTEARRRLSAFGGVRERAEPKDFRGTLRPYQREGIGWLHFLAEFGFGGCLADDMGLGKTVQLLAHIADRRYSLEGSGESPEAGPWLVVAPKTLVFNWTREAERFTPRLKVLDYTGPDRDSIAEQLPGADLVLTTYGTLRKDIPSLREVEFACVVLDESQAIKNADSQAAKAARLLRTRRRLALTGTPVENHLGDLWSLFEFLNPGMLGRAAAFRAALGRAGPSIGGGHEARETGSKGDDFALLRRALRPFILRRTKDRVAPELPQRTEQTIMCDLGPAQRALYDKLRRYFRAQVLGKVEQLGMKRAGIHVLEALLRLRQAACHPALIESEPRAGRVPKRAGTTNGELRKRRPAPPDGAPADSAKVGTLLEMVEELIDEGHKALVFSQFTSFLALVREQLDARNLQYEYLDGATSARDRAAGVDRFQTDGSRSLFLISLKAGGVGLNLTAADYVFLLDPWWNPAVEAQAIDRTHRIGQEKKVFAYRIIARDTVEERILELQRTKRELAAAIIGDQGDGAAAAAGGPLSTLTREDLEWLLA